MWDGILLSGFADEIDMDLGKQIEVLKKLDIHHVEMRGVNGKGLVEHSINEAKEIKKQLDEAGIRLSSVGSPIGKIKSPMILPLTWSFTSIQWKLPM
uniref:hypothetical protein n=1 Tax=Clostridium sp. NkU-1 TaxID=1095009 RepID=UPI003261042D